jgi:hypothetical protein
MNIIENVCLDGLNFLGVRTNALFVNDMPQVLYHFLSKAGLCFTHINFSRLIKRFQEDARALGVWPPT